MNYKLPIRTITRFGTILSTAAILVAGASCQERGYRTEVTAGNEGNVQVKKIPVATPPSAGVATPPADAAQLQDAQFTQIEVLWQTLDQSQRQKLVDSARQMASHEH